MILYIGERQDEPFVKEIGKGVTDEIRMITDVHTITDLKANVQAIPYSYLVINVLCIRENPDALIKQLKYIQTQINSNLVVVASGLMSDDPMIQSLYFAGIKNVIITSWFPNIASQCIKYLSGTYQETELLENGPQQTTKLDLKEIYQDDPVILKQLEELEQEQEQKKLANDPNDTIKLSPEQLGLREEDLKIQVEEYEQELKEPQSTTLYNKENILQEDMPYVPNLFEPLNPPYGQGSVSSVIQSNVVSPDQGGDVISPQPAITPPYIPSNMISTEQQVNKKENKKEKNKSKKPMLVTACLCGILILSIVIPVIYTRMHNDKRKETAENLLAGEKTEEETIAPTPERIVVGAVPDVEETESPTLMTPDREVNSGQTEAPSPTEEAVITLTPIKGESNEEEEPTKSPEETPQMTKAPEKTKEPEKTKAPEKTKKPEATKTPEPKEIKIKSIELPTSVCVLKGGSYRITVSYSPSNANESVSWSSSDSKIASVKNGTLSAKKAGTVTVTVKSKSGVKKSCTVVVSEE